MSRKNKTIGIAVLAIMILAGTALAQGPGGWSPQAGGYEMGSGQEGPGGPGQQGGFGMESGRSLRKGPTRGSEFGSRTTKAIGLS